MLTILQRKLGYHLIPPLRKLMHRGTNLHNVVMDIWSELLQQHFHEVKKAYFPLAALWLIQRHWHLLRH